MHHFLSGAEHIVIVPPSAAFSAAPRSRLAALSVRRNVILVNVTGAVDASANLVDVRGDTADSDSQLLLLGVIDLDDVPVNQHFAGIRPEVAGAELVHLVANQTQLLLIQADFLADGSCAVWHIEILLSQYNGHFFSKTW